MEIKNIMGLSRKLKLTSNSFELIAKYTKSNFLDEEGIVAGIEKAKIALEEARNVEIGTAKSRPSLRFEINKKD